MEFEDTGAGMPPETLERIFDPFFSTKEDGGTGLGLAISKRIVDDVGGSLEARSTEGEGSRFTAMVLGAGYLGQGHLAAESPWSVGDRTVLGRDRLNG